MLVALENRTGWCCFRCSECRRLIPEHAASYQISLYHVLTYPSKSDPALANLQWNSLLEGPTSIYLHSVTHIRAVHDLLLCTMRGSVSGASRVGPRAGESGMLFDWSD